MDSENESDGLLSIYKSLSASREQENCNLDEQTRETNPLSIDNVHNPSRTNDNGVGSADPNQLVGSSRPRRVKAPGTDVPLRTRKEHLEALRQQGLGRKRKDEDKRKTSSLSGRSSSSSEEDRKRKPRTQKNVLVRMKECEGPLELLYRSVRDHLKVKVWIRSAKSVRGFCTGYVIAFDQHWNLAMVDVDELYKPFRSRPVVVDEHSDDQKKKRRRKRTRGPHHKPQLGLVGNMDVAKSPSVTQLDGTADSTDSEHSSSVEEGSGDDEGSEVSSASDTTLESDGCDDAIPSALREKYAKLKLELEALKQGKRSQQSCESHKPDSSLEPGSNHAEYSETVKKELTSEEENDGTEIGEEDIDSTPLHRIVIHSNSNLENSRSGDEDPVLHPESLEPAGEENTSHNAGTESQTFRKSYEHSRQKSHMRRVVMTGMVSKKERVEKTCSDIVSKKELMEDTVKSAPQVRLKKERPGSSSEHPKEPSHEASMKEEIQNKHSYDDEQKEVSEMMADPVKSASPVRPGKESPETSNEALMEEEIQHTYSNDVQFEQKQKRESEMMEESVVKSLSQVRTEKESPESSSKRPKEPSHVAPIEEEFRHKQSQEGDVESEQEKVSEQKETGDLRSKLQALQLQKNDGDDEQEEDMETLQREAEDLRTKLRDLRHQIRHAEKDRTYSLDDDNHESSHESDIDNISEMDQHSYGSGDKKKTHRQHRSHRTDGEDHSCEYDRAYRPGRESHSNERDPARDEERSHRRKSDRHQREKKKEKLSRRYERESRHSKRDRHDRRRDERSHRERYVHSPDRDRDRGRRHQERSQPERERAGSWEGRQMNEPYDRQNKWDRNTREHKTRDQREREHDPTPLSEEYYDRRQGSRGRDDRTRETRKGDGFPTEGSARFDDKQFSRARDEVGPTSSQRRESDRYRREYPEREEEYRESSSRKHRSKSPKHSERDFTSVRSMAESQHHRHRPTSPVDALHSQGRLSSSIDNRPSLSDAEKENIPVSEASQSAEENDGTEIGKQISIPHHFTGIYPAAEKRSFFLKTLGVPVGDTGLYKRHVSQILVRGDNVVMIAICQ